MIDYVGVNVNYPGAFQCMVFDPVVRYGPGSLNRCQERENQGEPAPNAPYATNLNV